MIQSWKSCKKKKKTQNQTLHTKMSIPALLFEQCVKYIARHIGWVDTLQGVPDIIGERLWKGCVENESFLHNDADTRCGLTLFVNAYGREFLESFKCKGPYLLTEYCECLIVMCVTVTHLDVSGCQLGNNNDFLRAVVNMKDLKVLNLSRNELSDGGFRLLLARHRMFQEGFQVLQSCDVSQNIVSLKTLNTFLQMPQLRSIRVSIASSLKKVPKFLQLWTANIKKSSFKILPLDQMITSSVTTKGLGAQIIHVWERNVDEQEADRLRKAQEKSKSFYVPILKQCNDHVFKPETDSEQFDTYTYTRDTLSHSVGSLGKPPELMNKGEIKRKRDVFQESNNVVSMASKKKKELDSDMDLLNLYRL